MDGSQLGELQFESFNAAEVTVTCHGVNVHPGSAKNAMVNAISLGQQFNSLLPSHEVPERTEGYEGFYHLMNFTGNVEKQLYNILFATMTKNSLSYVKTHDGNS